MGPSAAMRHPVSPEVIGIAKCLCGILLQLNLQYWHQGNWWVVETSLINSTPLFIVNQKYGHKGVY